MAGTGVLCHVGTGTLTPHTFIDFLNKQFISVICDTHYNSLSKDMFIDFSFVDEVCYFYFSWLILNFISFSFMAFNWTLTKRILLYTIRCIVLPHPQYLHKRLTRRCRTRKRFYNIFCLFCNHNALLQIEKTVQKLAHLMKLSRVASENEWKQTQPEVQDKKVCCAFY